jgi:hypothetical protein
VTAVGPDVLTARLIPHRSKEHTMFEIVTSLVRPIGKHAGRLLYRGPSLDALHRLAKDRSLDEQAPVRAVSEVRIDADRATVWRVLSDLASWPSLDIGVSAMSAPARVAVDESFTWTNGGMPLTSRLAVVDHGREISWTGVTYGVKAVHRQHLTDDGKGGTLLRSEESMAAPLLALVYPSRKLQRDLATFVTAIKRASEAVLVPA